MYSSILIAPSAYKGTLSAVEVAQAMSVGVETAFPGVHIVQAPVADGGDGTLDALYMAMGGTRQFVDVLGALDQPVRASWLPIEHQGTKTAVIELACASGLGMLSGLELKPMQAHTLGIGMVLLDCLERGYKSIVVCVGGSASTDGGSGLLHALGARFFNGEGAELSLGGGALSAIVSCDLSQLRRWRDVKIAVATDVTSPLLGPNGAAFIFGPQKGASAKQVFALDACLAKFADVLEAASGNNVRTSVGAGAAGGTAFGLACAMTQKS